MSMIQRSSEVDSKIVLVTGGAGYVGSHLVRMLLEGRHKVKVIDRFLFGKRPIHSLSFFYPDQLKIIEGDIRNSSDLDHALKGVNAIIHLAAIVGDPACSADANMAVETNFEATSVLADKAKSLKIKRFLFPSTCSVYGRSEGNADEESEPHPISLYGTTKLESENYLRQAFDSEFQPVILRLATLFGLSPRMRFDLVVNFLSQKAIFDRKIKIFGGDQWRPFVHVNDAARVLKLILEIDNWDDVAGKIFNVGSTAQNLRIRDLGDIIRKELPETQVLTIEGGHDQRSYKILFSKIQQILGFDPNFSVAAGIKEIRDSIYQGNIVDPNLPEYYNYRIWD